MIFAIYKPKDISSAKALNIVKKKFPGEKIGHAGTLDPLAEGVLVVAVGADTKRLKHEVAAEKEYIADIMLGATSTTDDEEGAKTVRTIAASPSRGIVDQALQKFVGNIEQTPPLYSAVKIGGREAYKYARRGKPVELKPRTVKIKNIELLDYRYPRIKLKVTTGPGVYIRSLARDLGEVLKTGGYLAGLLRTRVGKYTIETAERIEKGA